MAAEREVRREDRPIAVQDVELVNKSSDSSVEMSFQSVRIEMQDRVAAANFKVEKKMDVSDSMDIM